MNTNKLTFAIYTGISTLYLNQVHASGFQLSEHSASGLGRAFAGEAAIADNAAVLSRNPAAMTRFGQAAISGAISYIDATVSIDSSKEDVSDVVPGAFVPAGYYIQPLNDKWAVGFAMYSNFGLATDFDADYFAGEMGGVTELATFNLNPNVSYKVNNQLSVGAGVSVVYGEAELSRNCGDKLAAASSFFPNAAGCSASSNTSASLKGNGWGYGWNVGALYEINEQNRFGIAYHSKVDIDLEGDYYSDLATYSSESGNMGKLTLNLPDIFEFSGYHKVTPTTAVHYSAMWTGWSRFKSLEATVGDTTVLSKDEHFSDTWRYALGATYDMNSKLALSVGMAYEAAASVTEESISIPDSNRWQYSTGLTYRFTDKLSMDLGASYIIGDKVIFNEQSYSSTGSLISSYDFISKGEVIITSVQVNYLL